MKKKIVLTRYIDPETGEYQEKRKVIDSVYQENDFVMNYRKKKYTIEQGAFLPADIGCFFVGMFYLLIPYLNNDNMLEIDKRPITHTDIADICGASKNSVTKFLKVTKELDAIRVVRYHNNRWFVVNPAMANFGKRVSYISYKIFEDFMLDNRVFVPVDLSRYEEEFKLL